jgi:hypothetical protein
MRYLGCALVVLLLFWVIAIVVGLWLGWSQVTW